MKILAISDVEEAVLFEMTKRQKIGTVDLIISCGDLSADYLSYISTIYGAPLFFVRGNHDHWLTSDVFLGENLHGRLVKYQTFRFAGFEGSLGHTATDIQYTDADMARLVRRVLVKTSLKGTPDIVATHAPPRGIHEGGDGSHRGFAAFTKVIERMAPKFFLHGHTHLNYGLNLSRLSVVDRTTVINVCGYYVLEL